MKFSKRERLFGERQIKKADLTPGKRYNPNQILRYSIRAYYKGQKWEALLKYLLFLEGRQQLPDSWRWQIGQMFIYNNEAKKGLDYLQGLHSENADNPNIQLAIIAALHALGKSECSFQWIKKPRIRIVERETLLECYNLLRKKMNALPLFILYATIRDKQGLNFDEFDLLFALKKDPRFHILNDSCFFRFSRIGLKAEELKIIA